MSYIGNQTMKTITAIGEATGGPSVTIGEDTNGIELFEYDPLNRMTKASVNNTATTYTYDGNGLRQSKTTNGVTTSHIYDGQNIVMDDKDGEKQVYHRGISLISRTVNGGSKEYYTFNPHGDTAQLVSANGTILKDYTYDAFGNQKQEQTADNNPFRYCGEYFDTETNFIYLRARYYDPSMGRFTTEDTHWNPSNMIYGDNKVVDGSAVLQSGNLFVYCINNPIKYFDFTGNVVSLEPDQGMTIKDVLIKILSYKNSWIIANQSGDEKLMRYYQNTAEFLRIVLMRTAEFGFDKNLKNMVMNLLEADSGGTIDDVQRIIDYYDNNYSDYDKKKAIPMNKDNGIYTSNINWILNRGEFYDDKRNGFVVIRHHSPGGDEYTVWDSRLYILNLEYPGSGSTGGSQATEWTMGN